MFRSAVGIFFMTVAVSSGVQAATSPAKEQLINRVLQLWHVENIGTTMLQEPVAESLRQSRSLLQGRVSLEKQDAAMKEITQYAKEFFDDATPIVRGSAQKMIPSTVAPILAEKFSEEELRQIIALLESPVKKKFESAIPEMQSALGKKIAQDTGPAINPKLEALKERIGLKMRAAIAP
ncbi:DUF2059 domain-containing protein [Undibacterium piscinae]|jgi:hypothetical protein|uniref:DUF2059 domain-containing protein n=1 Tax=Undibacterium piscinae TaxID=2495591 RepID=A0A6M4A027_9BURK|nr:DUF2059 domain-containing protein [Undibacterium piscinae]